MTQLPEKEMKALVKEALREWLDEQFAKFGRWTATGIAAAGLTALVYLILMLNGWKLPS